MAATATSPARRPQRRAPAPLRRVAAAAAGRARALRTALTSGERPLLVVLVLVLAVSALMLAGPVTRWLDGRDRVRLLERQQAALDAEIARLEARERDLLSAEHVELLARENLGLVRPGEIPYVAVAPEHDTPQVVAPVAADAAPRPWYRRLWQALADLVR